MEREFVWVSYDFGYKIRPELYVPNPKDMDKLIKEHDHQLNLSLAVEHLMKDLKIDAHVIQLGDDIHITMKKCDLPAFTDAVAKYGRLRHVR